MSFHAISPTRTLAARAALASLVLALAACATPPAIAPHAYVDPIGLFPMADYDQNVDHWIAPASANYDTPFLSTAQQRAHWEAYLARYFGTREHDASPWNPAFITNRLYGQGGADIVDLQLRRIGNYDNEGKPTRSIGYGQNYRPHTAQWIYDVERNMNLQQFSQAPHYAPNARAIATDALLVRELPTMDPSFYSHRLAGEGYPFDNLQISSVRPGTPLYVLGHSIDGAWDYVQTPDVQGWVQAHGVGFVDDAFVSAWSHRASDGWGVVIAASMPVRDQRGTFRFDATAGTLLPLAQSATAAALQYTVLVPARDIDGRAVIREAQMPDAALAPAPIAATPHHLAVLIKSLIGRPYGWGNMNFYNDCSSELQSIFATFGVWLPRHSSAQMTAGDMTDLSSDSPAQRIDYLVEHGKPMRTLIYIGGHVMLYLGNTTRDGRTVPLVYQDIWGMRPADNSRRAVIGGSVIFPLLLRIPEDPSLESLAATRIFQVSVLGMPSGAAPPPDEENPAS
ncbi:SH3 domain-containing C40 family peptidase [Trinickia acidisoli]|uniref:SH3 domain-containing C40 family peptidase n=1 Tax=Trinickia acidisoli TaxID=2767482 RepID=UPI001A8F3F14|nr:SH3 domain-containing C40 family peptidase [Trinickia acidisoli]